jgi:O-antigen biosynthesis protein WbqP
MKPETAGLKRSYSKLIFDTTLAFLLLVVFSIPMLLVAALVKITSRGPALSWLGRVG